jgi:6,7-dimethyl-8-ribityllumazine synthase
VTQGVTALNVQADVPVVFSVLTVLNRQQALDRCGGRLGNKGVEGAVTAIHMANLIED